MKFFKKCSLVALSLMLAGSLVACSSSGGSSAEFPSKSIELTVPFSAGGGTDSVARALADAAKDQFSQPITVVNKTGGGGAVGMTAGAKAKADGHALTFATVELVTVPHTSETQFTYEDFKPVLQVNADPACIVVKADSKMNSIEDFINEAKSNPGKIRVGNSGVGAIWHLGAATLEKEAGVELNHVPYEGAAPAVAALLGEHIEAVACSPGEVISQVQAGELKILGVMSDERLEALPEVKTVKEQGYDVVVGTWRGVVAPKDTPDDVVKTLEEGFSAAAEKSEFEEFLTKANLGYEVQGSEAFSELIKDQDTTFKSLIADLGLSK